MVFKIIPLGIEIKCKCGHLWYKIVFDKDRVKVYSINKLGVERLERQL